ncbi:MAG TPA: AAA family ATPase [Candidatus Dormibacteraeota bacterium]
MRIKQLELRSFGPFRGRHLDFAPGLNVIWGPNESGKSTAHSALVALICGLPPPGERRPEDIAFADRHRPWAGDAPPWSLGGRLEVSSKLDVTIDRRFDGAPNGDLPPPEVTGANGQDVGAGLIWEGSADCSRWIGFNRRTFALTAAVAQADVLRVVLSPAVLYDDLRRAAEGGELDMSVERALELLDIDLEEQLHDAVERLTAANSELQRVVAARDRQVRLQMEAEAAQERAERQALTLRLVEGAAVARRAADMRKRADRAAELLQLYPQAPPAEAPPSSVEQQVAAALTAWSARPEVPELDGPTIVQIKARLDSIKDQPVEGDLVPDPGVLAAREVYEYANQELDRHWHARPAEVPAVVSPLSSGVLRDLAHAIETQGPEPPAKLLRRRDADDRPHPVTYARMQGLEPEPAALRSLADRVSVYEAAQVEQKKWSARQKRLRQESINADARLRSALSTRGYEAPQGQVMQTVFLYVRDCEERARIAARADEKEKLAEQLRARELLEKRRAEALAANERASEGIRAAAKLAKLKGRVVDQLATELRAGMDEIEQERRERAQAREAWRELTQLLEGRQLAEIEKEATRRERRLAAFVKELGPEALASVEAADDGGEQLAQARKDTESAARAAAQALSALEAASFIDHPAEAEEAWGEVAREAWELGAYRSALELARERLTEAALTMNADIAPAIAAMLGRWLPRISLGRYTEAWVDPISLQVDVRGPGGDWQPAGMLSHATAEQVYLLLRLALAEHLTVEDRSCPLLLDDVTVHSDAERTEALLEILHEVSADHQVIFFTREERILEWAERHLDRQRDSVQRLEEIAAPVLA